MSQKIQFALVVFIAIVLVSLLLRPQPPQAPTVQEFQITQSEERSITVTGEGELKVKPDTVEFIISIETEEKELEPAKAENEQIAQEVKAVLKKNEIAESDIESDFLRIKTDAVKTRVYNYTVDRKIRVTLRDLTKIEGLFTELLETGASQISDVSFQVSLLEFYDEQALRLAIQTATKKAIALAEEMGQKIGDPLSITEIQSAIRYPYNYPDALTLSGIELDYVFDDINAAAFGELTIKAGVMIEFQLK